MIRRAGPFFLAALLVFGPPGVEAAEEFEFRSGDRTLRATLCKPDGAGPFPAVVYNHGSLTGRGEVGGIPGPTCHALAAAGFVGISPYRRRERGNIRDQILDTDSALNAVAALPYVDSARIGVMGFSQGAMLSFIAAARNKIAKAVVVMAGGATPKGGAGDAARVDVPVMVLVASNDTGSPTTGGHNVVRETQEMVDGLRAANKNVIYTVYPAYPGDGHQMFAELGSYWTDVIAFFKTHL